MVKAIRVFLGDLCSDLGFCIPPEDQEKLSSAQHWKADDLACAVIRAEGMDPECEVKWRREIRNKFRAKFGEEVSFDDFPDSVN